MFYLKKIFTRNEIKDPRNDKIVPVVFAVFTLHCSERNVTIFLQHFDLQQASGDASASATMTREKNVAKKSKSCSGIKRENEPKTVPKSTKKIQIHQRIFNDRYKKANMRNIFHVSKWTNNRTDGRTGERTVESFIAFDTCHWATYWVDREYTQRDFGICTEKE